MKLSKAQADIIEKMKNGWELGTSMSIDPHSWIQKGGLGKGGEAQTVSHSTIWALLK